MQSNTTQAHFISKCCIYTCATRFDLYAFQLSAGKHCSTTTLNYIVAHNLQTEFKEVSL
jgi:hypothetical protein